ncbi:M12 family metallo-peptidase [Aromatoleum toluclasticum]|uniref:M12 family metallo-peptidase n=1 Tax=Aromatoleum toluclasticum TaxID=92003 RepID=UPI00037A98B5|nr:M12 family metallo-peptidase [Aromatoleum toluclasticum]
MKSNTTTNALRHRATRLARLAGTGLFTALLAFSSATTVSAAPVPAADGSEAALGTTLASKAARAEQLTQSLADLHAQYRAAPTHQQPARLDELAAAIAERKALLAELIKNDPASALRLALSPSVRAGMPAQVRNALEQHVDVAGELEVFYEEYPNKKARLVHYLRTPQGQRISLHFKTQPPSLLTGTQVRAKGVQLDSSMALESGETSLTLAAKGGATGGSNGGTPAPGPSATGEHRTLVVLVNFQDNPIQPYTPDFAKSVLTTTNDYFLENSHQQMWLNADVAGWFTIANSSSVCDTNAIGTQAQAAASAAGYNLSAYTHLVYAFPQIACGWWGLSSVGGSPSNTWITGELKIGVTAHELGHAIGLFHSHSNDCGADTLGATCTTYEYGDQFDMMGSSSTGHYNAFQKERLGWLNTSSTAPITTVTSDGVFTLEPYAASGTGPKALKIPKGIDPLTGQQAWYYVEFRQAVGFDSVLAGNTNVLNGVLIHTATSFNGNSANLLDMTPNSGTSLYLDWKDPALVVGGTFTDPASGVSITSDVVSATQAVVTVRFGSGGSTSSALLSATGSTSQTTYTRGQTVYLTANVNAGGVPVAGATVSFTVTKANGSQVKGSATTGSDGKALYQFQLKKPDPVGTYQTGMVAAFNGQSATTAVSFNVQ